MPYSWLHIGLTPTIFFFNCCLTRVLIALRQGAECFYDNVANTEAKAGKNKAASQSLQTGVLD